MPASRRSRRAFALSAFAAPIAARAQLDRNDEWDGQLRKFIVQFNRFIESLNSGLYDAKQWKRVEEAWRRLDKEG